MTITVTAQMAAPIHQVWSAYTEPAHIVQWNAASDDWHTTHAEVDLREGGSFISRMEAKDGSEGFDFAGHYTRVIPHELIEYRFGERSASVTFSEVDGGSEVTVEFEPEDENSLELQRAGWQAILDNFARHVDSSATTGLGS